jgi:hypothetical protein
MSAEVRNIRVEPCAHKIAPYKASPAMTKGPKGSNAHESNTTPIAVIFTCGLITSEAQPNEPSQG